ncbi:MAG: hypothetical protein AB7N29_09745 [Vicinamibacterales bacterium]
MTRPLSLCLLALALATAALDAQQVPKGQMPTLGRPTQTGDEVPLLDFDSYFVGKWTFEWSMPETALGPAGDYTGTTTYTKVSDGRYEAVTEGQGPDGAFTVREAIAYQRANKTVSREITDSRGHNRTESGPVGGDLGGIYNVHYESAPFSYGGKTIRLKNTLRLVSPLAYRVATSISVDGGPFTNLGNPWWRKNP